MGEEIGGLVFGQTQRGVRLPTHRHRIIEDITEFVEAERSKQNQQVGQRCQSAVESRREDIQ